MVYGCLISLNQGYWKKSFPHIKFNVILICINVKKSLLDCYFTSIFKETLNSYSFELIEVLFFSSMIFFFFPLVGDAEWTSVCLETTMVGCVALQNEVELTPTGASPYWALNLVGVWAMAEFGLWMSIPYYCLSLTFFGLCERSVCFSIVVCVIHY